MSASTQTFNTEAVQQMLKTRHFDEVHRICNSTLQDPGTAEANLKAARHFQGMAYYFQNNLGKSIECFKSVLEMDPKYTDAAITLSVIYNDIGRYDEAKRVYQMANQSLSQKRQGADSGLDRKFAIKHIEIGDLYFKYNRFDEAMEDYSKAIRLDPQQLDHRIKLAKVYAKKGFTTRAIQELQQICTENPSYISARIHLGLMYFSIGNVIDAQEEWNKALMQEPHNQEIRTYLDMARDATETTT